MRLERSAPIRRLEKNDLFYEKAGSYNNWKSYGQSKIGKHFIRERVTKKGYRTREGRSLSRATRYTQARSTPNSGILIRHQPNAQMVRGTHFQRRAQTMKTPAPTQKRPSISLPIQTPTRFEEVFRQLRSIIERREERGRRQVVVAKKCRVDRLDFFRIVL